MPLSAGQVLKKRYQIEKVINQGGFGAVYLARDTITNKACAIKESLGNAPTSQLKKEASILQGLDHPNLPRVTDYFTTPQAQYLVMEYVEGENLQQIIEKSGKQPLSVSQVSRWLEQICKALTYLHSRTPPVIHRDIKPANIILAASTGQVKLVDLGIAKIYVPGLPTTTGSSRGGTPGYSPPEQYAGSGKTDERSDIYALGATLYTLLTGVDEPLESVLRHAQQLPAPTVFNPSLSPRLEAVILKAMELDPDRRYPSVQALWKDWRRAASPFPLSPPAITPNQKRVGALLRMQRALKSNDLRRIAAAYQSQVSDVYQTLAPDEQQLLQAALAAFPWLK